MSSTTLTALGGAIDCDIHPAVPNARALLPHMDEYWREHMLRRGLERENFDLSAYPVNAPINVRPDWKLEKGPPGSSLADMQAHVLEPMGTGLAICNVLHGAQAMMSEDLSAALCRGVNNWLAAEWLDRDPRLRASILVPQHSGELAAEEIERMAGDRRFVQVLMLAMAELPPGRRQLWPIYRAAEKHGLPIGLHAGSTFRHPPSAGGWGSTLMEDYVSYAQGFAAALNSLLAEGVFQKFPDLKVVLIESGVTWLPASMWRINKTWRGVRSEVPWLNKLPADIIRARVRLTAQPLDAPADSAGLGMVLEQLGSEDMLLFASDYPHWQYDGADAVPAGIPAGMLQKMMVENARATYPRLKAA
ncbi:MAG: amidohydrolase [Acetobacteraceae bacterium]|nr:amidohydrolase [Acetobacteraceae bacterium]